MSVSTYVAAAIVGNFKVESNVNPGIWESLIPMSWDYQYDYNDPNKGGYGLGQWTNVGSPHGRLYNMHTWVTSSGYADGDGNGQMAYIPVENVWYAASSAMGFSTLSDFLSSTSNYLDGLVRDWMTCWEGLPSGHSSFSDRRNAAYTFLPEIQQHANDNPSLYTWVSSNAYLGWSDMINNAICVYFALNGWSPQPPTPTPQPLDDTTLTVMMGRKNKWWII